MPDLDFARGTTPLVAGGSIPEDDGGVLALIGDAIRGAAEELASS